MSQIIFLTPASGPGSGTVTSISAGTGITLTPNPITTTGTVALTVPVAIANGGTNATSMTTSNGTVYYDGTRLVTTATGTAGFVLTSNGASAPSYQAAPAGGVVTIDGNTGSATGSTITFQSTNANTGFGNAFTASGSTVTLAIGDASSNVCLGQQAGFTISGSFNNTYIGNNAGNNNNGSRNTCIGTLSGGNGLVSGTGNVMVGDLTGINYTSSESNNILLGRNNRGVVGDNNTIRLGDPGEQSICFIAGITGVTTGGASNVVVVDANGKLGTVSGGTTANNNITTNSAQPAFSVYLGSNVTNATGNGTPWQLGTTTALTKLYDVGSNITTGGVFTAPVTGLYYFSASVLVLNNTLSNELIITFTSSGSDSKNVRNNRAASPDNFGCGASALIQLNATQTLSVSFTVNGNAGDTCTIQGAQVNTWFTGILIC